MEDTIGAGAVCQKLADAGYFVATDIARMARRLFLACKDDLPNILRETQGGSNRIRASYRGFSVLHASGVAGMLAK